MSHITEADLGAVERWFFATLEQCHRLRACQRHAAAETSATGALKMFRVLRETQGEHGFFADLISAPSEVEFIRFVRA